MAIDFTPRQLGRMGAIGLVGSAAALFGGYADVALGLVAGTAISLLKYYLGLSALRRGEVLAPQAAQRLLLRSVAWRHGLSFVSLIAASPLGPEFLMGLVLGLTLEVYTYIGMGAKAAFFPK